MFISEVIESKSESTNDVAARDRTSAALPRPCVDHSDSMSEVARQKSPTS